MRTMLLWVFHCLLLCRLWKNPRNCYGCKILRPGKPLGRRMTDCDSDLVDP